MGRNFALGYDWVETLGRQTQWETIQKILEQAMPSDEDGLGAYVALALGWESQWFLFCCCTGES